jgi:hypothetical protein
MVVENAAFLVSISNTAIVTSATVSIGTGLPQVVFGSPVRMPDFGSPNSRIDFAASTPVKAYLEPNGLVDFGIQRAGPGTGDMHFVLTGYLVNP